MSNSKIKLEISMFFSNDRMVVIEPGAPRPIEIQDGARFTPNELKRVCRIAEIVAEW